MTMEYVHPLIVLIILSSTLYVCASATNYTVGGTAGWNLWSNLQNWSSNKTFFSGDNLEFTYGRTHDVLEVNQVSFSTCLRNKPIRTHTGGHTVIALDRPGTRYFICGRANHCDSGLKLKVDVLSQADSRQRKQLPTPPPKASSPSPSPPKNTPPPLPFAPPNSPAPSQTPTSDALRQVTSLLLLPLFMVLFMSSVSTPLYYTTNPS